MMMTMRVVAESKTVMRLASQALVWRKWFSWDWVAWRGEKGREQGFAEAEAEVSNSGSKAPFFSSSLFSLSCLAGHSLTLRTEVKNQRAKKAVSPIATECLSESVPMCEKRY